MHRPTWLVNVNAAAGPVVEVLDPAVTSSQRVIRRSTCNRMRPPAIESPSATPINVLLRICCSRALKIRLLARHHNPIHGDMPPRSDPPVVAQSRPFAIRRTAAPPGPIRRVTAAVRLNVKRAVAAIPWSTATIHNRRQHFGRMNYRQATETQACPLAAARSAGDSAPAGGFVGAFAPVQGNIRILRWHRRCRLNVQRVAG